MKKLAPLHLPRMRVEGLVIDELPDEVLVYDLKRHKAHCLNQTAAMVWHHCDGESGSAQIAQRLTRELQTPFAEDLVLLALVQLEKLHLLEESKSMPPELPRLSRRRMIRNLGLAAAVAVPVVTSIVSPTPVEAGTCAPAGSPCSDPRGCCIGCNGSTCV